MREFRDESGVEWRVFLTPRGTDAVSKGTALPEAFREGWLVFESAVEKRRLAPVPPDWESMSDAQLAVLNSRAVPQLARTKGTSPPEGAQPQQLRPKLQQAEQQLDRTLEEVCETPNPSKLDTGELIRVEETLALAAEAAKEAVSIRRKMRADAERSAPARGSANEEGSSEDRPR
jgi:hypothetical protein